MTMLSKLMTDVVEYDLKPLGGQLRLYERPDPAAVLMLALGAGALLVQGSSDVAESAAVVVGAGPGGRALSCRPEPST